MEGPPPFVIIPWSMRVEVGRLVYVYGTDLAATKLSRSNLSISSLVFWPKLSLLGLAPEAGCLQVRYGCKVVANSDTDLELRFISPVFFSPPLFYIVLLELRSLVQKKHF